MTRKALILWLRFLGKCGHSRSRRRLGQYLRRAPATASTIGNVAPQLTADSVDRAGALVGGGCE